MKKLLKNIIDWLMNLVIAVSAMICLWLLLQVFVFSSFRIPSDSMEPELQAGDCVLVNKMLVGARLFNIFKSVNGEQVTIHRMPGFSTIQRNDVLVFNFPHPKRWSRIEMDVMKYFVKRCMALPGDTFRIIDGKYSVNNISTPLGNVMEESMIGRQPDSTFDKAVYLCFPYDSILQWNIKRFGPLYIPKAGRMIDMNQKNFILYRKLIAWEQHAAVTYKDSTVFVGKQSITHYRFLKNYYFMAGDNCANSQDSRYWGMLPEEYIVGKAVIVWKSVDPYSGKFLWHRFLKKIR